MTSELIIEVTDHFIFDQFAAELCVVASMFTGSYCCTRKEKRLPAEQKVQEVHCSLNNINTPGLSCR